MGGNGDPTRPGQRPTGRPTHRRPFGLPAQFNPLNRTQATPAEDPLENGRGLPAASTPARAELPAAPEAPPQATDRRTGLTPVSFFLVLLIAYITYKIQIVVILTLLALVFATVIEGPLRRLEARRIPRGVGILIIYVTILGAVALLVVGLVPAVSDQADNFRTDVPTQLRELQTEWRASSNPLLSGSGADLLGRAAAAIEQPPSPEGDTAINVLTMIAGGIVGLFTVFATAFYYLMEKQFLRRVLLQEINPNLRSRVNRLWDESEAKVGDWLRGQLTLCLIIGLAATIGYGIMGIEFWPLLGLWAGITEIIPIVGPWLGGIPAVVIAMTMGWDKAIMVVIFILLLQFTENTVLVPRVMRGAVGLTPLTVFVAILAGTQFYGPIGAILAIPIAALVQILITDYLDRRRGNQRGTSLNLPGWRWMRGPLATSGDAGHGAAGSSHYPVDPAELRSSNASSEPEPNGDSTAPATPFFSSTNAPGWTTDLLNRAAQRLGVATKPQAAIDEDEPAPEEPGADGPGSR